MPTRGFLILRYISRSRCAGWFRVLGSYLLSCRVLGQLRDALTAARLVCEDGGSLARRRGTVTGRHSTVSIALADSHTLCGNNHLCLLLQVRTLCPCLSKQRCASDSNRPTSASTMRSGILQPVGEAEGGGEGRSRNRSRGRAATGSVGRTNA